MKKISKEDLVAIQNHFNTLMENKIHLLENKEALRSINKMPFFKIKNIFESISGVLFNDEKNKHFIGDYMNTIMESKSLKTLNAITESINKANLPKNVDANIYLTECVKLINKCDRKEMNESLNKLRKIVENCAKATSLNAEEINNSSQGTNHLMNESFDYVINNKVTPITLGDYLSNFAVVKDYLNENRVTSEVNENKTELTFDDIITENLSEWEKSAINDISLNTLSGNDDSVLFERYKQECIGLISESLEDEELENKARFETMKLQLESKTYNKETFVDDILKLSELKETLE